MHWSATAIYLAASHIQFLQMQLQGQCSRWDSHNAMRMLCTAWHVTVSNFESTLTINKVH